MPKHDILTEEDVERIYCEQMALRESDPFIRMMQDAIADIVRRAIQDEPTITIDDLLGSEDQTRH
jgi:hypothetical protein